MKVERSNSQVFYATIKDIHNKYVIVKFDNTLKDKFISFVKPSNGHSIEISLEDMKDMLICIKDVIENKEPTVAYIDNEVVHLEKEEK